jgi:hypothetical protein
MLLKKMPLILLNQLLSLPPGSREREESQELRDHLGHLDLKEKEEGMDLMVWMVCKVLLEMFSSFLPIWAQAKDLTTNYSQ